MNLLIDSGNTFTKLAIFIGDDPVETIKVEGFPRDLSQLTNFNTAQIEAVMLSSVRKESAHELHQLLANIGVDIPALILTHQTPIPLGNKYDSKATLGYDRIAAAVGANSLFPDENLVVIDSGTALTLDVVTSDNCFMGGNIAPGADMRFRALNSFTQKLPLFTASTHFPSIGTTTQTAIKAGVMQGMLHEIDGFIDMVASKFGPVRALLTGGDSIFFENKLKNIIFAEPHLVLKGLNKILKHNLI